MKNLTMALDSGAYSLYNTKFARDKRSTQRNRASANYDYVKHPEFKEYLDGYVEFLNLHSAALDFYVNVDIIYNPQDTMKVQKYLESNGLSPIPVYHYGEPVSILKHYIDNYEYIGVGGLGQSISPKTYIEFGDKVFKYVCDRHGKPRVKVHGFAMTSIQLMARYPWYSCDSSSWGYQSRNGWVRFPRAALNGSFDFLASPISLRFTDKTVKDKSHLKKQSQITVAYVENYLSEKVGLTVDDLRQHYWARDAANIAHTYLVCEAVKKLYAEMWDWGDGGNMYLAGRTGDVMTAHNLKRVMSLGRKLMTEGTEFRYLASYFYPDEAETALSCLQPSIRRTLDGV